METLLYLVVWWIQGRYFQKIFQIYREQIFLFREDILETVKREFIEETMNSNTNTVKQIQELFKKPIAVNKIQSISDNQDFVFIDLQRLC